MKVRRHRRFFEKSVSSFFWLLVNMLEDESTHEKELCCWELGGGFQTNPGVTKIRLCTCFMIMIISLRSKGKKNLAYNDPEAIKILKIQRY